MAYEAKILADSINENGNRLTTFEVTFPRFELSSFNTHRSLCLAGSTLITVRETETSKEYTITLQDAYIFRDFFKNKQILSMCTDAEIGLHPFFNNIKDITYSGKKSVCYMELEANKVLLLTEHHRFLTENGWQTLSSRYTENTKVYCLNNGKIVYSPIKKVSYDFGINTDTYDIEVEGPYHNFIADGVVVHNSRNSASSRAIPTWKQLLKVIEDPVIPFFQKNKSGMQSTEDFSKEEFEKVKQIWLNSCNDAIYNAYCMADKSEGLHSIDRTVSKAEYAGWLKVRKYLETLGYDVVFGSDYLPVHKQFVNRILEPYMWHTVIVSTTDWANFFALRCHKDTQKDIKDIAVWMLDLYKSNKPTLKYNGEWHLPLVSKEEELQYEGETLAKVSAARCARVSYLTHDGIRDINKDIELYTKLAIAEPKHFSPLEMPALCTNDTFYLGNYIGWKQYRKFFKDENITSLI